MSSEVSIHRDVLTVCEDMLSDTDIPAVEYIDQFPDDTVFEVPIETVQEYNDDLLEKWRDQPHLIERHIAKALRSLHDDPESEEANLLVSNTTVRIQGYTEDELYDVGQYRPEDIAGRTIHLRGQITKRSKRKLRDEVTAFECERCGRITNVPQTGRKFTEPHECPGCDRGGPFNVDDSRTAMRDFQNLQIQTLPEETDDGESKNIDVMVFDELVGHLSPGDRAVLNTEMKAVRQSHDSRVRELEGEVRAIEKLNTDFSDVDTEEWEDDIYEIVEGDHPDYDDPRIACRDSVAPFHTGDEKIKDAIVLQVFSGVEKELPDGTWMRGNSHVLLMGDPGVGKTTIIEYVSKLVPRSEYATGKNTSTAGLTATVQKDEFEEGGWTLEGGTLVKANNGLAAIDELDKMDPDDRDGMMEAMSQQRITVSMVTSGVMPAKCSVLAAANPKFGSFDPMQDIGSQLDLDSVLLSRFDLWFVMVDEVDEEKDEMIARDVTDQGRAGQKEAAGLLDEDDDDYEEPAIPPEMFRAYVAMAQDVHPVFTDEAANRIVREYVDLRQLNDGKGPVPTTARVVTALHRLSEAAARVRLDTDVTLDDVEWAIDILRDSLDSLGIDPDTGDYDATRFEMGTSTSKMDKRKAVLGIIEGKQTEDEPASRSEVREEAMVLMDEDEFEDTLEALDKNDDVYHPEGPGSLRTL